MKEIKKCKTAVFEMYKRYYESSFIFHNYTYTVFAAEALDTLIEAEKIKDEQQILKLKLAVWLHAVGYYKDLEVGGETSVHLAKEYMVDAGYEDAFINEVLALVAVTNYKNGPSNLLEEIMNDVSFHFFFAKNFNELYQLWRVQQESIKNRKLSNDEWGAHVKGYLNHVQFYTYYAIRNWETKVRFNYLKVLSREEKQNEKLIEKGKDTVFRITLRNHISLSDNADRKAHILLSVNAIVISIIFSRIFPKLDNPSNHFLYVPTLVFIVFTVLSIILSVIATRPRVTKGKFSYEELTHKKVNILFFGNFYRVKLQDYERAMDKLLQDGDLIYSSLTKDLYYLGKVVAKKYRILQYTYVVFMIGIVISTMMYVIYFNMYN